MNKRIWALIIVAATFLVCLVGLGSLAFLGLALNVGPFGGESRAQMMIRFQGGTRITLEADAPADVVISDDQMQTEAAIIQARINGLGFNSIVKIQDSRHLIIAVPGKNLSSEAKMLIGGTGLLEFVDAADTPLEPGTIIKTTGLSTVAVPAPGVYQTIMTGKYLSWANVQFNQSTGLPYVEFLLTPDGSKIFANFTSKNINKHLAVVLDKKVIASPVIKSPITDGSGIIEGAFTQAEAHNLVVQLEYGALPFPLKIVDQTPVTP